ncbi:hypothetical protein MRX96_057474 [Rhipicephalus microplus]
MVVGEIVDPVNVTCSAKTSFVSSLRKLIAGNLTVLRRWRQGGKQAGNGQEINNAGSVEGHMLLVVIDAKTKWLETIFRRSMTAEATVAQSRSKLTYRRCFAGATGYGSRLKGGTG